MHIFCWVWRKLPNIIIIILLSQKSKDVDFQEQFYPYSYNPKVY